MLKTVSHGYCSQYQERSNNGYRGGGYGSGGGNHSWFQGNGKSTCYKNPLDYRGFWISCTICLCNTMYKIAWKAMKKATWNTEEVYMELYAEKVECFLKLIA